MATLADPELIDLLHHPDPDEPHLIKYGVCPTCLHLQAKCFTPRCNWQIHLPSFKHQSADLVRLELNHNGYS